MRIGFIQSSTNRIALRNDQGQKVGYLASVAGQQVYQSPEGKTIARILRFKRDYINARPGAQGGTLLPEAWWI